MKISLTSCWCWDNICEVRLSGNEVPLTCCWAWCEMWSECLAEEKAVICTRRWSWGGRWWDYWVGKNGSVTSHLLLVMRCDLMRMHGRTRLVSLTSCWSGDQICIKKDRKRHNATHFLFIMACDMMRLPGRIKGSVTHNLLDMEWQWESNRGW